MNMRRFAYILAGLLLSVSCTPRQAPADRPQVPEFEQIEYLSDHLAVGVSGGTAYLLTADGQIVATADDSESLKAGAEAAYARFLDEEYASWEAVLEQYDSLCNACIARRPADELLRHLEAFRTGLQGTVGKMDAQQQARFAAIRERYDKYRK